MPDDAKRFRDRAQHCRNLAKSARNNMDAELLEDIAADLDEAAEEIDAERNV
jgi:hypothetical protein